MSLERFDKKNKITIVRYYVAVMRYISLEVGVGIVKIDKVCAAALNL